MAHSDYQLVQLASLGAAFDEKLAAKYRVLPLWDDALAPDQLAVAANAAVVVTSVRKGLSRELIEGLPALRAVCSWGVGLRNTRYHDRLRARNCN